LYGAEFLGTFDPKANAHAMNKLFLVTLFLCCACGPSAKEQHAAAASCGHNLRVIDAVKEEIALEEKKRDGENIDPAKLAAYTKGGMPKCPSGGSYTLGSLGTLPTCSTPGHSIVMGDSTESDVELRLGDDARRARAGKVRPY
jgi:hypothetical protein